MSSACTPSGWLGIALPRTSIPASVYAPFARLDATADRRARRDRADRRGLSSCAALSPNSTEFSVNPLATTEARRYRECRRTDKRRGGLPASTDVILGVPWAKPGRPLRDPMMSRDWAVSERSNWNTIPTTVLATIAASDVKIRTPEKRPGWSRGPRLLRRGPAIALRRSQARHGSSDGQRVGSPRPELGRRTSFDRANPLVHRISSTRGADKKGRLVGMLWRPAQMVPFGWFGASDRILIRRQTLICFLTRHKYQQCQFALPNTCSKDVTTFLMRRFAAFSIKA